MDKARISYQPSTRIKPSEVPVALRANGTSQRYPISQYVHCKSHINWAQQVAQACSPQLLGRVKQRDNKFKVSLDYSLYTHFPKCVNVI